MNIKLLESISKNMFAQCVLVLSVWLFILNVQVPLLQNDPNGSYEDPAVFTVVSTEYLLNEPVFD